MQRDAALEVPVHADPRRAGVPPIPVHILEGVAVSRPLHETRRLVRNRVVGRVREWAERIVGGVDAGRVDVVLGAWCAVLEVVAAPVLRHPGAFDERMDRRIAMVLAEALPAMLRRVETEQPLGRSFISEMPALIE